MLKHVVAVALFGFAANSALAASCAAMAAERQLNGAAKNGFMTKCEFDAAAVCDRTATGRKLAGAAKANFVKKCVADAVGRK